MLYRESIPQAPTCFGIGIPSDRINPTEAPKIGRIIRNHKVKPSSKRLRHISQKIL